MNSEFDSQNIDPDFDPNGVGNTTNNIFGLPFDHKDSKVVIIPMPWDVTTSNEAGTAGGPGNIFRQSFQIDLYDPLAPSAWKQGMAMEISDPLIESQNLEYRRQAERVIRYLESGKKSEHSVEVLDMQTSINRACESMAIELESKCLQYLSNDQLPIVLGGDHSTPLGLIRALGRNGDFGILQIDAHADMREAYQGFTHSHASIMYNALHTQGVNSIVQVGIRELCQEEVQRISTHHKQVKTFFDHDLHQRLFEGETWKDLCEEIVEKLPEQVYISFDVDGLQPALCPGTGTPVPGGLNYNQALYLMETLLNKGKVIVGADLSETGPSAMDGIVSSRLLYRLAGLMIKSQE